MFRIRTGAALTHVPYRGSAPAVQDLAAGHIPAMFDPVQSPLGQIQAGRVRALAVSAPARSPALPEVPTMAEAGVSGHEMVAWWAVVAPRAIPEAAAARLAAEIARIAQRPDWREGLARLGISPMLLQGEELAAFLDQERRRWGEAVRVSGASAD